MGDCMLAEKWSDEDPVGWWVSEKLDGVRAIWKNGEFISRGDNKFACPDWFAKKMPKGCVLDGELWGGRRQFQKTVGIVKSTARANEWEFLTYMVFDILVEGGKPVEHRPFEERLASIRCACATGGDVLKPVPMERCRGRENLQELLTEIESRGGEGLMLRRPGSLYEKRRSKSLLKVKTFHDDEAIVVDHENGKGRLASSCGALLCETPDKRKFKVGSGLSDAQRSNPPKIGTVITYRYQELTNANIPRFPTFVGERVDLKWCQICATYVAPGKRIETALRKKVSVLFSEGPASAASASASAALGSAGSAATGSGASAASGAAGLASAADVHMPATAPLLPRIKRKLSGEDIAQRAVAIHDLEDWALEEPEESKLPPAKRPRTTVVDKRPLCVYGSKCYRSNPDHFDEFAHPWLDEENEDAVFIVPPDAGLSSAPEAAPERFGPKASEVPPSIAARTHNEASTEMPAEASSGSAVGTGGIGCARDVRIIALRTLLSNLVKDSIEGAEREHFQHLLNLLNAGPSMKDQRSEACSSKRASEMLPPFPPPDHPPPLSMIRTMPPPTTAALPPSVTAPALEASASAASRSPPELDALHRAETLVVSPEEFAIAVSVAMPAHAVPVCISPNSDLSKIMDLGFSAADAAEALKHGSDIQASIEWLLSR